MVEFPGDGCECRGAGPAGPGRLGAGIGRGRVPGCAWSSSRVPACPCEAVGNAPESRRNGFRCQCAPVGRIGGGSGVRWHGGGIPAGCGGVGVLAVAVGGSGRCFGQCRCDWSSRFAVAMASSPSAYGKTAWARCRCIPPDWPASSSSSPNCFQESRPMWCPLLAESRPVGSRFPHG